MGDDFGESLKEIRTERHMSLDQMAQLLGTTKQALSRYERGERTPKITVAAKFAEILGVSLEELLGYEYHSLKDEMEILKDEQEHYIPYNNETKIIARALDQMTSAQRIQILNVLKAMFPDDAHKFADYVEEYNNGMY